jgi:hypothetical protein
MVEKTKPEATKFVEAPRPDWWGKKRYKWTFDEPLKDETGGEHPTIELREPKIGEFETAMSEQGNGKEEISGAALTFSLIHQITGKPMAVLREIPYSVFKVMTDYLTSFT